MGVLVLVVANVNIGHIENMTSRILNESQKKMSYQMKFVRNASNLVVFNILKYWYKYLQFAVIFGNFVEHEH